MRHLAQARNDDGQLDSSAARRFAKDKIVTVILALEEPFAVLALMNSGVELRDRQNLITANETALVAQAAR